MREYNLVVIGASFAGLCCAIETARQGLTVAVFEKDKEVGQHIRTTGIFPAGTCERNSIPEKFCTNAIDTLNFYSPKGKHVRVKGKQPRVYMSKTREYLQHLASEARRLGVTIYTNHLFTKAKKDKKIVCSFKSGRDFYADFVIGADGCMSNTARVFGLSQNKSLIAGKEYIVKNQNLPENEFFCYFDTDLAYGYSAWVAPNESKMHIGLACQPGKINEKLERHYRRVAEKFNIKKNEILEKHSGFVPVGGSLRQVYNKSCLLLGDAAGLASPLSMAGIPGAIESGRVGARAVVMYLRTGETGYLKAYRDFVKSYEIVNKEILPRKMYNLIDTNHKLETVFDVLKDNKHLVQAMFLDRTKVRKREIAKIFLENPRILKCFIQRGK